MPSDKTVMFYGFLLGMAALYLVGSSAGKSEIAASCADYGEVKIDGKMYVCKEKVLAHPTPTN
jgi:hypothetical protein